MTKKVYIVTGATGFVGNTVVKQLLVEGEQVVLFVRSERKLKEVFGEKFNGNVVFGDVLEKDKLEKLFETAQKLSKNAQICFVHAASIVYLGRNKKKIREMFDVNINGAKNVIELCLKYKARLLYVSSVHSIPENGKRGLIVETQNFEPKKVVGTYAKSKALASQLVMDAIKSDDLDAVLVHPSGITGPNDYSCTHLTQMVEDYMAKRIPAATGGGYDFVDVRDVAVGIRKACLLGKTGDCFLLSNKYYTVKEMLGYLSEITGGKRIKMKLPLWMAKLGLLFLGLYFKVRKKRPLYNLYSLYTLGSNSNFSHEKAAKELDFKPRELKDSLSDTVEFLRNKTDRR